MRRYLKNPIFIVFLFLLLTWILTVIFVWPWMTFKESPTISNDLMPMIVPDTIWISKTGLDIDGFYFMNKHLLFGLEPYAIVNDSILFKIPVTVK